MKAKNPPQFSLAITLVSELTRQPLERTASAPPSRPAELIPEKNTFKGKLSEAYPLRLHKWNDYLNTEPVSRYNNVINWLQENWTHESFQEYGWKVEC